MYKSIILDDVSNIDDVIMQLYWLYRKPMLGINENRSISYSISSCNKFYAHIDLFGGYMIHSIDYFDKWINNNYSSTFHNDLYLKLNKIGNYLEDCQFIGGLPHDISIELFKKYINFLLWFRGEYNDQILTIVPNYASRIATIRFRDEEKYYDHYPIIPNEYNITKYIYVFTVIREKKINCRKYPIADERYIFAHIAHLPLHIIEQILNYNKPKCYCQAQYDFLSD